MVSINRGAKSERLYGCLGELAPRKNLNLNTQVSIYSHLSRLEVAIMGEVRGKRYSNMDE